jgi:threonine synthase
MGLRSMDAGKLGDTPLIRARKIEEYLGVERFYLKLETYNPTGTHKDRAASLHVEKAFENHFDTLVTGSCGNYGTSIAYYANLKGLNARLYLPKKFLSPRATEMQERYNATIVTVDGLYEDAVEMSKRDAVQNNWFDANPGTHQQLGLMGYSKIASEIFEVIGEAPETVSVPVGNGTTLAGIYHGFRELREMGKIDRMPRMIAASTDGGNPVVESFINHREKIVDIPREAIRESEINEPLVNYHAYDGDIAYEALVESNGFAEYVTDAEMKAYKELIRKIEGVEAIPAATASVAALVHVLGKNRISGDHVSIITG